jgi:regulator of ribonuclease activity A
MPFQDGSPCFERHFIGEKGSSGVENNSCMRAGRKRAVRGGGHGENASRVFHLLGPISTMSNTSVFATCDLCDAHKNDTSGAFRVLPPVFQSYGAAQRFFGQVVTVKCFEDNSLVKAAVDSAGEGRVLVVDGGASQRRALLGGNLGASAARNGWAGVVIDGCVRDVAELAECQTGIRALAAMPLPTEKRNQGQRDVAVQVQGVWVRPGDWVYADEDGIVVSATALHG